MAGGWGLRDNVTVTSDVKTAFSWAFCPVSPAVLVEGQTSWPTSQIPGPGV